MICEVVGLINDYNIFLFGFPVRVFVWILIAFFLGLIFTMLQWPEFWRKVFSKKHAESVAQRKGEPSVEEKAQLYAANSKKVTLFLFWIVLFVLALVVLFYIVGRVF